MAIKKIKNIIQRVFSMTWDMDYIQNAIYNDASGSQKGITVEPVIKALYTPNEQVSFGSYIKIVGSTLGIFGPGQVAGLTTDVTVTADFAGTAGNITLTADSIDDVDDLIATWNGANPTNTVTLTSGDGTQVPTVDIVLATGVDSSTTYGVDCVGKAHSASDTFRMGEVRTNTTFVYVANQHITDAHAFDADEWTKVADKTITGIPIATGQIVCVGKYHNAITVGGFTVLDETTYRKTE
jgi:hypothetical protein